MVNIAVDAMGGDNAPKAPVIGALQALDKLNDLNIFLVGKEGQIKKEIANVGQKIEDLDRLHIVDAQQIITGEDNPTKAVKTKKESSLIKSMILVKEKEVDAVVSAGNTGAFMAGGLLVVGRLANIRRPALAPVFPTFDGKGTVVLDVGATMDPKPEHLKDFAVMGSVYAEKVLNRKNPKIGLINVGEEAGKGDQLSKDTYPLLKEAPINFQGNVEARDLLSGSVDVAVCEGFMGNVLLKFLEGIGKGMFESMKEEFTSSYRGLLGTYLLKPNLKDLKKRFDYNEYGGAPFLGIDGVLVKTHGSSNNEAIKNAITKQVYYFVKEQVLTVFSEELKKGVKKNE